MTTHAHGADEMKENLSRIAHEISRVRDQAQEEAQALDKIRGMLDTGYLDALLENVQTLEVRIRELEDATLHSRSEVGHLHASLEEEQERLAKLWDAYKSQEDELARVKRDYPLLEEKLFERERTIEELRREISRIEPFARYKDDYDLAVAENMRLNHDLERLEGDLARANQTLQSQQAEVEALRAYESDSRRLGKVEADLAKEQERLAKLYKVYEDEQAAKKRVETRLAEWEKWFAKVRPSIEAAGAAPSTAPLQ